MKATRDEAEVKRTLEVLTETAEREKAIFLLLLLMQHVHEQQLVKFQMQLKKYLEDIRR